MSDYDKRLFAYQMAMALARSMRSKGLISAKEYAISVSGMTAILAFGAITVFLPRRKSI